MKFVGHDVDNARMEIMELDNHPYYVAVQVIIFFLFIMTLHLKPLVHLQARHLAPSLAYLGLILASVGKLQSFLSHGYQSATPSQELSDADRGEKEKTYVYSL